MSKPLRIEFDWLDRETGSEIDRAFAASIGLAVGEEYLTRIDDLGAKTVTNRMRGSGWHLATWFAANWWRLRWEPAPHEWWNQTDWCLAHSTAAAGGGYVWPNAVFASDGDSIEIVSSPKAKAAVFEPIRYINHVHARITVAEFEQRVGEFMDGVLSRTETLRVNDARLSNLWTEVLVERHDPDTAGRRKLEALLGYDPDDAPEDILALLLNDQNELGANALEEIAAAARHETEKVLKPIMAMGMAKKPKPGGHRANMPRLEISAFDQGEPHLPWQKANKLARFAREQWGFGNKPIGNKALADLLDNKPAIFTDGSVVDTQLPFALRTGANQDTFHVYFHKPNSTTRRFAASRMIGDHIGFSNHERLLPATRSKTWRQKFQRAFAQEFLCPIEALMEKIQTSQPDEDDLSEAAKYFGVSPLMVRTTLVNKGKLDREALSWPD